MVDRFLPVGGWGQRTAAELKDQRLGGETPFLCTCLLLGADGHLGDLIGRSQKTVQEAVSAIEVEPVVTTKRRTAEPFSSSLIVSPLLADASIGRAQPATAQGQTA
jgi:hypothetical protein